MQNGISKELVGERAAAIDAIEEASGTSGNYEYRRSIAVPFRAAVERTYAALKAEGFGVLMEIDLKEKFKEKLGVDFRDYVILGACNPPIAYQSLQEEMDLGLLLPCNVVVYEQNGGAVVAAIDAARVLSLVGNEKLNESARLIDERLRRAIDTV